MAEIIEVQATRYRCSVCKRGWAKKSTAEKHVMDCPHDPLTRGCLTCAHYVVEQPDAETGLSGCEGCAIGLGKETAVADISFGGEDIFSRTTDCDGWEPNLNKLANNQNYRRSITVHYCVNCGKVYSSAQKQCTSCNRGRTTSTTYDDDGMWTDQQRVALSIVRLHGEISVQDLEDCVNKKQTATINDLVRLELVEKDGVVLRPKGDCSVRQRRSLIDAETVQ